MRNTWLFLVSCVVAAVAPFVSLPSHSVPAVAEFPGWPAQFEGRWLKQLELSQQERSFERSFPGRIAKFTDGQRAIIFRWVTRETRMLHPASDCFKASGYRVVPGPLKRDLQGATWSSFQATRGDELLRVYERIQDNEGNGWTDVSAWYWAAVLGKTHGNWWAVTVTERWNEGTATEPL